MKQVIKFVCQMKTDKAVCQIKTGIAVYMSN